jgi:L-iditol 2-dehydrogenase
MGQLAAATGRALGAELVIVAGMTSHRLQNAVKHFADIAVDVNHEDLRQVVAERTHGRGMDVVLVAVSSGEALATGISMVRPGGTVNSFAGVPEGTSIGLDIRKLHYQQYYLTGSFGTSPGHMFKALELLQSSKVDYSSIISACYPFLKAGEAVAYVEHQLGLKAMVTFSTLQEVN